MSDPFSGIDTGNVPIREPKKSKTKYNQPTTTIPVTRVDGQRATGETAGMHGQYKQANFKLKPEVIDQIDEWARQLNVNKSQLKRYLTWRGLQALNEGERPEYIESSKMDLRDY
jgi:hypothetical protein